MTKPEGVKWLRLGWKLRRAQIRFTNRNGEEVGFTNLDDSKRGTVWFVRRDGNLYLVDDEDATERRDASGVALPDPPKFAGFILKLLADTAQREGAIGDFNEMFARERRGLGLEEARRRYRKRAFDSVWPLALRSLIRFVWASILRHFLG
jgi:hypothetical protein